MSPSFGLLCLLGLIGLVSSQQPCADPFKVGTYNVLQIPFASNREKRLDATIDYLRTNQLDLDVLCLQEVWEDDDRQDLVEDLRAQYPYSFWAPRLPQGECQGGCSSNELSQLRDCIDVSDCILGLFDDDDRYDCINDNCRDTLESVGASCSACLLSNDDLLGNLRNLDNCLSDDQPTDVCYAFDAWSDNLILSRVPLYDTQVLSFSQSPITYTTALYARVNTTEVGFAHIACTHLLPADLPALSFEEANNLNQTRELLQFIDSRRGNATEDIVILMGDFNNGPNEWEANHDVILEAGYASAYLAAGNNNCTYCSSNPLVSDAERTDSLIIDHIYIHNVFQTASTRFLTFYDFNIDRNGNGDRIPLSDHYGVRADLCPGPTPTNSPLAGAVNVNDSDNFEGDQGANGAAALAAGLAVTIAALAF